MPKDFAGVVLVHPSNIKKLRWIKWGKAFRVITSCTRLTLRSSPSTILLRKTAEPPLKRVPLPPCRNDKGAAPYWQFATDRYLKTTVKTILILFHKINYINPLMDHIPTKRVPSGH